MHPQDTTPLEEWRPVVGYEGWYSVSNLGRVRREVGGPGTRKGFVLRGARDTSGRLYVQLSKHAKNRAARIHILVARAFLGTPKLGYEVNHIDGDRCNNRLDNLEYVTEAENKAHAVRLGLVARGTKRPETHLSDDDIIAIRSSCEDAQLLAARYGVVAPTIGKIRRGERWKHIVGPLEPHTGKGHYARVPILSPDTIVSIRESTLPSRTLASTHGVSATTINDIRSGKRWGYLSTPSE